MGHGEGMNSGTCIMLMAADLVQIWGIKQILYSPGGKKRNLRCTKKRRATKRLPCIEKRNRVREKKTHQDAVRERKSLHQQERNPCNLMRESNINRF